jgi:hypothetical protein
MEFWEYMKGTHGPDWVFQLGKCCAQWRSAQDDALTMECRHEYRGDSLGISNRTMGYYWPQSF